MAKGNNLILDGLRGSMGGVTVTQWIDGEVVMKEKITRMTNPRTQGQRQQRAKMKAATASAAASRVNLYAVGVQNQGRRTAYNRLTSHLLKDVISLSPSGDLEFAFKRFNPTLSNTVSNVELEITPNVDTSDPDNIVLTAAVSHSGVPNVLESRTELKVVPALYATGKVQLGQPKSYGTLDAPSASIDITVTGPTVLYFYTEDTITGELQRCGKLVDMEMESALAVKDIEL